MTATRSPIVIPPALAPLTMEKRWVIWRWVTLPNGKITKPPFKGWSPSSEASTTNPKTWCTFEVAQYAYEIGASDGVGYMLKPGEVGAFDIDHCIDSAGVIHPWARKLISRCLHRDNAEQDRPQNYWKGERFQGSPQAAGTRCERGELRRFIGLPTDTSLSPGSSMVKRHNLPTLMLSLTLLLSNSMARHRQNRRRPAAIKNQRSTTSHL